MHWGLSPSYHYGVSDVAQIAGINDDPPVNANEIAFSNIYDAVDGDNYLVANVKATGGEVIPEPSSALLLLLGMAGIALRRKQA